MEAIQWHYIQEIIALSATKHSPTPTMWWSAPSAAPPITAPAGSRPVAVSMPTSMAPALNGHRSRQRTARQIPPRRSASAPTAARTTPRGQDSVTTAAPPLAPMPPVPAATRPIRGLSIPVPMVLIPAPVRGRRATVPAVQPVQPVSPAGLPGFSAGNCARTIPSTASRPRTGPVFWVRPA